jgi:hypothetical protein
MVLFAYLPSPIWLLYIARKRYEPAKDHARLCICLFKDYLKIEHLEMRALKAVFLRGVDFIR